MLATLESVPDPLVAVDARQHVVFVNRHVVHKFGFATAELVGKPLSLLVPGDLRGRRCLRRPRYAGSSPTILNVPSA